MEQARCETPWCGASMPSLPEVAAVRADEFLGRMELVQRWEEAVRGASTQTLWRLLHEIERRLGGRAVSVDSGYASDGQDSGARAAGAGRGAVL